MEPTVDLFKNEMECGGYHINKGEKYLEKYSRDKVRLFIAPKTS